MPVPKTVCAEAPGGDSNELWLVPGATHPSLVLLRALALSPNWVKMLCAQLTGTKVRFCFLWLFEMKLWQDLQAQ